MQAVKTEYAEGEIGQIRVAVPPALKRDLAARAIASRRTLTAELVTILERALVTENQRSAQ